MMPTAEPVALPLRLFAVAPDRLSNTNERGRMTIYTLRMPKVKSPGALSHVFEAKPGAGKGCICLPKSICQSVTTAQTVGVEGYMCLSREQMWGRTLSYGGDVCAECLAALSLYGEKQSPGFGE